MTPRKHDSTVLTPKKTTKSAPLRNCHRQDAADDHRDTDELE
jgi:hypothetical protein